MPRFAADKIPFSINGAVVGLADKLDMISSCFALGLLPTGSQDPYSLRRHAYGIIRIIEDHGLTLELKEALSCSLDNLPMFQKKQDLQYYPEINDTLVPDIKNFFRERLFQMNTEKGYRYDLVNAVLNAGAGFDDIFDFSQRLKILKLVSLKEWWPELVTVVERTFNIGKKANSRGSIDESAFTEPEERELWKLFKENEANINATIDKKKYAEASEKYCKIFAKPVHNFFDRVFVNVEDENVRNNRLLLLKKINELYSKKIADLSQIVMQNDTSQDISVAK